MVPYFGDFPVNAVIHIPINTFDSNDPAASVTATNLVNTDVHIHKDGGTTQRNNAAGITMTIDFDSITGNHLLAIDSSDNTVADFFQAGHEYQVRIEGATVDAGTINAWVGSFSLERAGGALALIKNGTYGLSALNALLAHADYGLAKLVRSTTPAQALSVDANGKVAVPDTQKVDVNTIKTQAVTCAAATTILAQVGAAGAPGANNGLTTTNGTKQNQTVDLTAAQSIACSDKTGFSLSATGLDLILHGATFMVACATAIWELAARTITALPAVTTDWLTGAGVKADAVTKIQAGLATPTNITAGTIATVTNLTNAPTNGDLTAAMKASVNAEVVDTLGTDTVAEMAQGAPPVAASLKLMVNYLYRKLRNKQETTATENKVFDDAGTTVLFKESHSDDATTFSRGEYGTGA